MDRHLQQLIDEHQEIEIPADLDHAVQRGIRKGLDASMRRTRTWRTLALSTSSAAAVLVLIVTMNAIPNLGSSLARTPGVGPLFNAVLFDSASERDMRLDFSAAENAPQTNNYTTTERNGTDNNESVTKSQDGLGIQGVVPTENQPESKILVHSDDKILSVQFTRPGAKRSTFSNIDVESNKTLSLQDLFQPDSGFESVLSAMITNTMNAQNVKAPDTFYAPSADESIVDYNHPFYVNEQHQLVIIFNQGDVAPESMGIAEFIIPASSISGMLTDDMAKYLQ